MYLDTATKVLGPEPKVGAEEVGAEEVGAEEAAAVTRDRISANDSSISSIRVCEGFETVDVLVIVNRRRAYRKEDGHIQLVGNYECPTPSREVQWQCRCISDGR